jgi:hypothetical protein
MIARFGAQGIVEARPGVQDDPDLPPVIFVESRGAALMKAAFAAAAPAMGPDSDARRAGWESEAQMEEFRSIRVRHTDRRR